MKTIAIIVSVILVLAIILAAFLNMPPFFTILMVVGVIGLGIYLFNKWASSGEPVQREKTIEYDIKTASAKLYKRVGSNLNNMDIKQYTKTTTQYNPSKTVFTGAVVGGVMMGGFHQTDAYLSETSQGGSGAYYLRVKVPSETELFENEYIILKRIVLSDELATQASKDKRVKQFLKGNTLVLEHDDTKTELTDSEKYILQQAIESFDIAMQENITQRAFFAKQLTWKECYDIKDWISGDVPQNKDQSSSTSKKPWENPSFCTYRAQKKYVCTCRKSPNYKKVCTSAADCQYYKDRRT